MEDLLIFLLVVGVIWVAVLLAYRRYNLKERGFTLYPAILMWRTKRGVGFIERVSKRFQGGWKAYGNLATGVGIFIMFFVLVNLAINAAILFARPALAFPGVRFVLPGLIPGLTLALWLIVIGVVLAVHELFHGFLLRGQGLQTKSIGAMLFLFIPGAFVEPDEKELWRAKPSKRMRMFAAGPVSNVLISFLFLGLILALLVPKPGVYIYGIAEGYPASAPGLYIHEIAENSPAENRLELGMRIFAMDNENMHTLENFYHFMENTVPGQVVRVWADNRNFSIELAENPENENRGFLGVVLTSRSLSLGMRLHSIDGENLDTRKDFHDFMEDTVPGQLIRVTADNWDFKISLAEDPENENAGYLGLIPVSATPRHQFLNPLHVLGNAVGVVLGAAVFHEYVYEALVPWVIIDVLRWLFALNLLVGFFNLLPAKPLDGGYVFEALLERRTSRRRARKITKVLSYFVLVLIILNLIPGLRRWFG
jgi:membrane-associated protease RseP (regulator of RpoE activity)